MAKVKTTGLTELLSELERLNANTDEILEDVVIAGASVTTDTMRAEIKKLKTTDEYGVKKKMRYANPKDVKGLLDSLGYAPTQTRVSKINSNVGFDGYNSNKTKNYPNGHANRMIANAINKGTSFMHAQPFINRTRRKANDKCIDEMQKELDREIKKFIK